MNRITTADIDAALHDQARADGYDARLLHTDRLLRDDTQPCETEDILPVEYEREPALSRENLRAGLFTVAGVLAILAGLVVLWAIRASNS